MKVGISCGKNIGPIKFITVFFFIAALVYSDPAVPNNQTGREYQVKVHDINQVEMSVSNYGMFGKSEEGNDGCWWPKGSNHWYIEGAGAWFGTIDSITGDTLVTIGYGPHGSETEYVPGLAGMSTSDPDAIIFMYPANWPPPAGTYPMASQTPISHQDSWCAYNDLDETAHVPGDTRPIGLEVYQSIYAWNLSTTQDIIFIKYEIKNVTAVLNQPHTLTDCYFGVATDNDIGVANNDIISGIVERWYVIDGESLFVDNLGYQWQEETEAGWEEFPGVMGFDYLQSPYDLEPGADKDSDDIPDEHERDSAWYADNLPESEWDVDLDGTPDWRDPSEIPQMGMTAFKRFTLSVEPNLDPERYLTLAGINYLTLVYEPFDTVPPQPDDQRFLQCSGPFDLEPDSTAVVLVAVIFAQWYDDYLRPDTALVEIDNTAQFIYDKNWLLPGPPPPPSVTLIPGDKEIKLVWNNLAEVSPDPYYDIVSIPGTPLYDPFYRQYDFEGYGIWRSITGYTDDWELLARCDMQNGIVFEDSTQPDSIRIRAEDTGIFHSFTDGDVRNGFTYHYAVTAFDYNYVKTVEGPDTFGTAIWFESGLVGNTVVPRRDPADYVPPGAVVVESQRGNVLLADYVDGTVISAFDVDVDRPVRVEYLASDTATVVITDTLGNAFPVGAALYTAVLEDADGAMVDSLSMAVRLGAGLVPHEFSMVDGIAVGVQFGTPDMGTFAQPFDSVAVVVGSYPVELIKYDLAVRLPTAESATDSLYMHGFWAWRGNDYRIEWVGAGGDAYTCRVFDAVTGDEILYRPYQNTRATRQLGAGWCFTWYGNMNPWVLYPSHDTLRPGTGVGNTRYLYINGGLIGLRNGTYMLDTLLPQDGDEWLVSANDDYTPPTAFGALRVSATPASYTDEVEALHVKVVPNPYVVGNEWQQQILRRKLRFINLPSTCTIRIFNLNGELVRTMLHVDTEVPEDGPTIPNNLGGDEWWDLLSDNRQLVASGIYIFHIDSNVGEQVGKFVVIH